MAAAPAAPVPSSSVDIVDNALAALAAGRAIVVLGDERLGQDGALTFAADLATPSLVAFVVRHSAGFLKVALPESEAERLELPPMVWTDRSVSVGGDAVAVDARDGVTTGISATDRAHTIELLASPRARAEDFTRPGHVVPVRVVDGGVLHHAGSVEAALDLVRLAGRRPAAAFSYVVSERQPAGMASTPELRAFAEDYGLAAVSVDDLVRYRCRSDRLVTRGAQARIPLPLATVTSYTYRSNYDEREHLAFVHGVVDGMDGVPVHVHFECIPGDVFTAVGCDCRELLEASFDRVTEAGRGVVVYIRSDEAHSVVPRRTGLTLVGAERVRHQPTDAGLATTDGRIVAEVLADLGVRSARLLTAGSSPGDVNAAWGLQIAGYESLTAEGSDRRTDVEGRFE